RGARGRFARARPIAFADRSVSGRAPGRRGVGRGLPPGSHSACGDRVADAGGRNGRGAAHFFWPRELPVFNAPGDLCGRSECAMKKGAVFNDAFLVCHEIYVAARELVNSRVPTTQLQSASKFLWRPDLRPRLVEYVADFARAGERALGEREKIRETSFCAGS